MALGIDLSPLFLILGALSVGIGFGLQSVVHDFISGLILLFERPVRIGDWITVEGEEGMVKRIGPRVSLLKTTLDGDIWIPNSKMTSFHVTNWTLASHAGHIRIASALNRDTDERRASEEDSATSMRAHTMPGKYALGRS
jgi:small-conductance mechanosensitive channel